jgi:hypothetical protein
VRENWDNETNELMNGSPGTMIAARVMLDRTGDERWAEAWRESADELWRRRYFDGFWSYPPYGKGIGASHGIGTNTNVLLAGGRLFPEERREPLVTGTSEALAPGRALARAAGPGSLLAVGGRRRRGPLRSRLPRRPHRHPHRRHLGVASTSK